MAKTDETTVNEFLKKHFFQVVGIVFTALNLWLSSKLATVTTEIRLIEQRVSAFESVKLVTQTEFDDYKESRERELDRLDERLGRIESKLDRLVK